MSEDRIIFMGTPEFAATALQALISAGKNVIAVYSQPPRPKGRGQQVQKSPVQELAEKHAIPVFTPKNFKDEEAVKEFKALEADVAVVAAYGLILPKSILDAPTHGCLNIHGSLLPRLRGAAPIQRAIWEGDDKTGITIMQMNEGLDTGSMILSEETPITDESTAQSLHDTLAEMGGRLIVKTLDILQDKKILCHTPQNDDKATYAHMLKKEDGKIDFTQSAIEIDRQVRALTPWPGTYCMVDGKRMKVHAVKCPHTLHPATSNAQAHNSPHPSPLSPASGGEGGGVGGGRGGFPTFGTILNKHGDVACGDGSILRLLTIQPENKKPMDTAAAFNGGYLKVGQILI